jgi:tRNAThr (cytosine32-N3)-methyltransferase
MVKLDELALMFTGSKALASQVTSTLSTSIAEDDSEAGGSTSEISTPDSNEQVPIQNPAVVNNIENLMSSDSNMHPQPPSSSQEDEASTTSQSPWIHPNLLSRPISDCLPHPLFTIEQLGIDRRLLVNRKRQLKMYRVWMQGKFRKIGP